VATITAATRAAAYRTAADRLLALCWHEGASDWAGLVASQVLALISGAAIHAPTEEILLRIATHPPGGGPLHPPSSATVRAALSADLDLAARCTTGEARAMIGQVAAALLVAWDAHSDDAEGDVLRRVVAACGSAR
jgi:hypothetical protein